MAPPAIADSTTSVDNNETSSHVVSLPPNIENGDLLVMGFVCRLNQTVTWPAGWEKIFEVNNGTQVTLSVARRKADGTEGATITVTTSASTEKSAHCGYRITGNVDPDTQEVEISVGATGDSANPDPDSLTPTGGAKDYLWLAFEGQQDPSAATGFPASYVNTQSIGTSAGQAANIASGARQLNAASEDPGTFTTPALKEWVAATAAVHPITAVAPEGSTQIDLVM